MTANNLSEISKRAQSTADDLFIDWCRVEEIAGALLEIDPTDEYNADKLASVTALSDHLARTLHDVRKLTRQCTEIIDSMVIWKFPA